MQKEMSQIAMTSSVQNEPPPENFLQEEVQSTSAMHPTTSKASEEEEYLALDELSETIPSTSHSALLNTDPEDFEDEELEPDPDDPDASESEEELELNRAAESASISFSAQTTKKLKLDVPATSPVKNDSLISFMGTDWLPSKKTNQPKKKAPKQDFCEDILMEDGNGLKSPDGLPVYGRKALTFASAEQLLLVGDTAHDGKTVCSSIPVYSPNMKGGFTFLIDAGSLYKIEDLPVDGYGSWTAGGSRASSRSRYYVKMANGDLMRVDSTVNKQREPPLWDLKLTQTRYVHPAASRCFRKFTYSVRDRNGGVKRWAAISYQWLTNPFTFKPLPHGNCKGGNKEMRPFQRTYPSVLAAMKQQLPIKMPKHVFTDIVSAYGVSADHPVPGLPRDRKQLYNMNREANREIGHRVDHRKWRKTGPGAGLPPGPELTEYIPMHNYHHEDEIAYIMESSELPGIPDEQFQIMRESAIALCDQPERFQLSIDSKHGMGVEDGSRWYTVRQDEMEPGKFRCSGCPDWRAYRCICRHSLAVADKLGKLTEHLEYVKMTKTQGTSIIAVTQDGTEHKVLTSADHHLIDSFDGTLQEDVITDGEVQMAHDDIPPEAAQYADYCFPPRRSKLITEVTLYRGVDPDSQMDYAVERRRIQKHFHYG